MRVVGRGGGDNTYVEPEYDVTVGWAARAPGKLFVTGGVNDDGVLEGACSFIIGALASIHSLFVTLCHATQEAKIVMPREWSVVRHRPLFFNTPNNPHSLSALALSCFLFSTASVPSQSSCLPLSMSF